MRYWENLIGVAKIDSNGAGSRTHSRGRRPLRIQVLVSTPDVGVQVPPRAPVKTVVSYETAVFYYPEDLNGSGSEWSAGGAPEPRPAAAHGGQVPPSRTSKNSRLVRRLFFAVAFLSAACYNFGVYARAERNILSQGGYEDEEKILDRDPYRRAAAEPSAGDDAIGGGGRCVVVGFL